MKCLSLEPETVLRRFRKFFTTDSGRADYSLKGVLDELDGESD